jgi:hypothetical protein
MRRVVLPILVPVVVATAVLPILVAVKVVVVLANVVLPILVAVVVANVALPILVAVANYLQTLSNQVIFKIFNLLFINNNLI